MERLYNLRVHDVESDFSRSLVHKQEWPPPTYIIPTFEPAKPEEQPIEIKQCKPVEH
jgi:hypothetical protein